MASEQNLTFQLGETWEITFALNDADGEDLDLTGGSVAFVLSLDGDTVLHLTSSADEIAVDSPSQGEGSIDVTPEDQDDLVPETYNYEIRATLSDGLVTTQAFGKLILTASLFSWPNAAT